MNDPKEKEKRTDSLQLLFLQIKNSRETWTSHEFIHSLTITYTVSMFVISPTTNSTWMKCCKTFTNPKIARCLVSDRSFQGEGAPDVLLRLGGGGLRQLPVVVGLEADQWLTAGSFLFGTARATRDTFTTTKGQLHYSRTNGDLINYYSGGLFHPTKSVFFVGMIKRPSKSRSIFLIDTRATSLAKSIWTTSVGIRHGCLFWGANKRWSVYPRRLGLCISFSGQFTLP